MIKVGLIDDQALIKQGIANLIELSEEATVVWEAENGQEALEQLQSFPVDILLCDIRMPVMDGISFVKVLRSQKNTTPVLMLTTFDDSELFIQSLQAGANGFLLKDVTLTKLMNAISHIANGGFLAEPVVLHQAVPQMKDSTEPMESLTTKENHILRLMAGGFSNKEIASALSIAEGTVKNHISNILSKMQCRDRTQAVLKAIHWKIIE